MSNQLKKAGCIFTLGLLLSTAAHAQKYKTIADTANLNKEYKSITSDLIELKAKLDKANSKTAEYQDKANKAKQAAEAAAEKSKDQAAVATDGNIKDINKELKKAKKASSEANDAKDAANDEKENQKEIKYLNSQIEKKQNKLAELDKERTAIMALPTTPAAGNR